MSNLKFSESGDLFNYHGHRIKLHIISKTRSRAFRISLSHFCSINRTGVISVWSLNSCFWEWHGKAILARVILFCCLYFFNYAHEIAQNINKLLCKQHAESWSWSINFFMVKKIKNSKLQIFTTVWPWIWPWPWGQKSKQMSYSEISYMN